MPRIHWTAETEVDRFFEDLYGHHGKKIERVHYVDYVSSRLAALSFVIRDFAFSKARRFSRTLIYSPRTTSERLNPELDRPNLTRTYFCITSVRTD